MKLGIALPEGAGLGTGDLAAAVDALPVRPALVPVWCRWNTETPRPTPPDAAYPSVAVRALADRGIRPVIFWEPAADHDQVLAGDWDSYLVTWAKAAEAAEVTTVVRLAHEQNAPWMPWSVGRGDNDAASYVAMWRHVVRIVRRYTARVLFLWCPDASHVKGIAPTWPGARWVDLLGLDGYRWPDRPRSPSAIYGPALAAVRRLSTLPFIVAEFGVSAQDPARRRWLTNAVRWFGSHGVYAAIYFDIDMRWNGKHPDWRLGDLAPRWDTLAKAAA